MRVSVVLDCADAVALAPFWSTALRYDLVFTGGEHAEDESRPAAVRKVSRRDRS